MKRFYFSLISITLIFLTSATFAQKSPLSYPQCRNTSGSSSPNAPSATIYLGDNGTFGCETWATLDGNWGKIRVVTSKSSDMSSASNGDWGSYVNSDAKTNTSARFTSTGIWYWAIQTDYNGSSNYWYCKNNSNWYDMWGTPTSDLTITVTALSDPISPSATQSSITQINLTWTKWNSKNVMVVRRLTSAAASNAPTQGTAYTVGVGAPQLGTGTVVYNANGTSFNDTGLTPGTSYTYTFYSENYSYYSAGATATASTATQTTSATDNFRSKATGNWSTASNWESSPDNTNWITSTLVPGVSAASITILNGINITLNADITIPNLTINTGGTFTASDATPRTLTISKSASGSSTTLSSSGTWSNGTGGSTVVFTGAPGSGDAIHAISGTIAFQNITVNKTGGSSNVGASFGANSSVSGTLEIGTGGFISTAPPTSFYGINAILKFNQGTGATYNVEATDNSWSITVIPNYITISSGTVNLNANRTATGNLLIDGGALVLKNSSSINLTINGNWTRSSGTFTANDAKVILSGTTNTVINSNGGATLYDLDVSKTGGAYVSLSSNLTVSHNLSISSGAILNIPSGQALTVSGTLTNSAGTGGLVVKSGGSLITNGSVSGLATIQREITSDNSWHFISSPVSGQTICDGNFAPTTGNFDQTNGEKYDFYTWSEPTVSGNLNWLNLKNTNWSLNTSDFGATPTFGVGKGYLVAYSSGFTGSTTKSFAGTLTSGDKTVALTTSGNTYNLIGNPFPSAINWDGVATTGILADGYYYVYNQAKSGGAGYESYKDATHKTTGATGKISATQGFFVKASGTPLMLPNSARVHDNNWMKSSQTSASDQLTLTLGNSTNYDEAFIVFEDQGTPKKDFLDADKMFSFDKEIPQVYSLTADNIKTTINSLPLAKEAFDIPLGMFIPADGNYTLRISGLESFATTQTIELFDLKLNTAQDLSSNSSYEFAASKSDDPNRFLLHFLDVTSVPDPSKQVSFGVTQQNGTIRVSTGMAVNAEIRVTNMLGQVVLRGKTNGNTLTTLNTATLRNGVYVVTLVGNSKVESRKIVVNR